MAIAFRAATNVATTTGNKPTGTTSGDILSAYVLDEGNHTLTPPSGWNLISNTFVQSAIRHAAWWKLAGGARYDNCYYASRAFG